MKITKAQLKQIIKEELEGFSKSHPDDEWYLEKPLSAEQGEEAARASLPLDVDFKAISLGAQMGKQEYIDLLATPAFQKDKRTKELGY